MQYYGLLHGRKLKRAIIFISLWSNLGESLILQVIGLSTNYSLILWLTSKRQPIRVCEKGGGWARWKEGIVRMLTPT